MRVRAVVTAIITIALLGYAASVNTSAAAIPDPSYGHRMEVERIRAHFDSVLVELADANGAALTAAQQVRRGKLMETLRGYRDRGLFPRNYDFAVPTPYFIDRTTGTLCAVAYLMESTGRRDLVERIAARDNNVWVAGLADDADVAPWLQRHGITLAEAARIQVPYVMDPPRETPEPTVGRNTAHLAGSVVTVGASFASILLRDHPNNRAVNILGVVSGSGALAMFANGSGREGVSPAVSVANLAVGSVALVVSSRSMLRGVMNGSRASASVDASATDESRVRLTPTVSPTEGAGLTLAVRF